MIGTILSIIGVILVSYIFLKTRKIEKESRERLKQLEIVYSIGLKEYNKSICRPPNQSKLQIIS